MTRIRAERPEDYAAVHRLNELAFGSPAEAALVDSLRKVLTTYVSLVAVTKGEIVGHILFTPVAIAAEGTTFTALGLGPMAVLPARQRQGIGTKLVRSGLRQCRRVGHDVVVVLGHPEYYPRFGFVRGSSKGIGCEFEAPDEAFMVAELAPDALHGRNGTVNYHRAFTHVSQPE